MFNTIVELRVVIIVIIILSILGFIQFAQMIEKGRIAEAKATLLRIREAERAYYLDHLAYTTSLDLDVDAPTKCTSTHYFSYAIINATNSNFIAQATRCTDTQGKPPRGPSNYNITLDAGGRWGGTEGYY